ncbi:MAG: stage III sporulation protein AD [Lachnospiraceae bacterium]|nr:stage III sporulation protein AD [Lachnospiraceae bacterium]
MEIVRVAVLGVAAVLLALWLKNDRPEYGIYLSLAAGIIILSLAVSQLSAVVDTISKIASYISIDKKYITILLKVTGVAYICEFAANLCRDSGYASVASQIEMAGKISIMVMSLPVMMSLIDTIESFLQ